MTELLRRRIQWAASQYGTGVAAAYARDLDAQHQFRRGPNSSVVLVLLDALAGFDPLLNKSCLPWLAKRYAAGDFFLEDEERVSDVLKRFHDLKPILRRLSISIGSVTEAIQRIASATPT